MLIVIIEILKNNQICYFYLKKNKLNTIDLLQSLNF